MLNPYLVIAERFKTAHPEVEKFILANRFGYRIGDVGF
jgi:hypothetical protein